MPSLDDYLALVPAQHQGAPRFIASLKAVLGPLVVQQARLAAMPAAFDLDEAQGVQLDAIGRWVGVGRFVTLPIPSVWFTFDDPALGWDTGLWHTPFELETAGFRLDDATYRTLLRARIAANHWDGTLAGAASALAYVYADQNTHVFIQDDQDLTYTLNVAGQPLSAVELGLLTGNYIPLKPAGVRLAAVNVVSIGGSPLFGFDLNNTSVAGFDTGAWGT